MTVEELRLEAKKLGYNIIKKPESVKLLPCLCGRKRVEIYYTHNFKDKSKSGHFYWCQQCYLEGAVGRTKIEARKRWNEAVERAKANETLGR